LHARKKRERAQKRARMGQKTSKLSAKEITLLSRETHFSPDEILHWYGGFLNDCPTGKLSLSEFVRIYVEFFPHGNPKEFAK